MANEEILELQIRDNAAVAASSLVQLSDALVKVRDAVGKGLRMKGTANALETLKQAVSSGLSEETIKRWERLASVLTELKNVGGIKIAGVKNVAEQLDVSDKLQDARQEAQATMEVAANAAENIEVPVRTRVGNLKEFTTKAFGAIKDGIGKAFDGMKDGFGDLGDAIGGFRERVGQLISDFKRIAKYRMMRSIIKQITEAFTTGVKNVYHWSKAMGGSFAESMDHAATSLLQFKNSIGAAVAPLIQSILPYIEQLISWLIEGINYLNQFLALLRGQSSWTRAIRKSVNAFDDQKKAAKGAAKALKELLADWDELNIIQSETGGGSGGGNLNNAEDYLNMFVEETEFSKYLKENFNDILETVKLIGAALLAWKFSRMFTGILSSLSKLVAGGALIIIGTKLSYGSGFSAGSKGYFEFSDIAGAIGGTIANIIGGSLIGTAIAGPAGGVVGALIGFTVGVVATLTGWLEGQEDLKDRSKWGNMTMTQESIRKFVEDQFTFDATATIKLYNATIQNQRGAKAHLNTMIYEFVQSLDKAEISASLDIDSEETSINVQTALAKAKEAIGTVQELLKQSGEGVSVIFNDFKFTNANGQDITGDILDSINIADQSLSSYFIGIGEQISALILEGEKSGWKNGEKQAALELMESQQRILNEAQKMQSELTLDTKISASSRKIDKNTIIDRDTAKAIKEEQEQALAEYTESARAAIQEQVDSWDYLSALARAASEEERRNGHFEVADELLADANTYHDKAVELFSGMDKAIDDKLAETRANMARSWAETLKVVYGEDFMNDFTNGEFGVRLKDKLGSAKNAKLAGSRLKEFIERLLINDDPNGIVKYVLNDLQGNVYDLLDREMVEQLKKNLLSITKGDTELAAEIFKNAFDLTEDDVRELFHLNPDYVQDALEEVVEDVDLDADVNLKFEADPEKFYKQLEEAIDYAVSDGVITVEEELNLKKRFSEGEYLDALERLGVEMDKYGNVTNYSFGEFEKNFRDSSAYNNGTRQIASAGMTYSDVGKGTNVVIPYTGTTGNDEQMASDMERGVRNGNEPQNDLIRSMINQLEALNRKQWTVNVNPSSAWGANNARSEEAFRRVRG